MKNKIWVTTIVIMGLAGCDSSTSTTTLAPTASALTVATTPIPQASKFTLDKSASKIEFMMDAPKEKIMGRINSNVEGSIQVVLTDISKTVGLITADLDALELFQRVASESGEFGEEVKNDTQNGHARTWLEISKDTPDEIRKKNQRVEFAIRSVDKVSEGNIEKMQGTDRKVTFSVSGELLLHGHKANKVVEMEAVFHCEAAKCSSAKVRTVKPIPVDLAEHDVRPREAFGKLAQKTLEVLAPKVARVAMVSLEFQIALQ